MTSTAMSARSPALSCSAGWDGGMGMGWYWWVLILIFKRPASPLSAPALPIPSFPSDCHLPVTTRGSVYFSLQRYDGTLEKRRRWRRRWPLRPWPPHKRLFHSDCPPRKYGRFHLRLWCIISHQSCTMSTLTNCFDFICFSR